MRDLDDEPRLTGNTLTERLLALREVHATSLHCSRLEIRELALLAGLVEVVSSLQTMVANGRETNERGAQK